MELLATVEALRSWRRGVAEEVALVPTMGALHPGHLALLGAARDGGGRVVCSIFVNPLQFNEAADYERYPRPIAEDLVAAEAAGVDAVFAPQADDLYAGGEPLVRVDPGPFADGLEGRQRPGHFVGVATVVAKLFALVAPTRAYFGEKDFEQLQLVRRMVLDLSFPVRVVACPTVREPDGLARSSRNRLLRPGDREAAPALYRALQAGAALVESGHADGAEGAMAAALAAVPGFAPEYAVVRDEATLGPLSPESAAARLLVAGRFGTVRLIDNLRAVPPPGAAVAAGRSGAPGPAGT